MRKLIIIFSLLNAGHLFAQDNLLVNFSVQQIENTIHLSFTVRGGITCLGTEVHRAQDSVHFTTIGTIPGICGSDVSDENYTFDDVQPFKNQNNFYRISFGQLGNSTVVKIKFTDYGDGFLIAPNPATGTQTIFFSNLDHQYITFSVYNLNGEMLQSVETSGDKVTLNSQLIPSGIYFLQASNTTGILFTGKIIFQ